jgi:hypothetical protein
MALSLIQDEKTTYIYIENGGGAGIVSWKRRYISRPVWAESNPKTVFCRSNRGAFIEKNYVALSHKRELSRWNNSQHFAKPHILAIKVFKIIRVREWQQETFKLLLLWIATFDSRDFTVSTRHNQS